MSVRFHKTLVCLAILISPALLRAEALTGVVRNVNHSSHSFGLDVPPVTRVYVTEGTHFEAPDGSKISLKDLKEGDQVETEGKSGGPGIFTARSVKVTGNLEPVKQLQSAEVSILPGQNFILGVNQIAVLRDEGKVVLSLHSTEFINTLCKNGGYDCSGEGEVGMRITVNHGKDQSEIVLTSKNHRKPTSPVKVNLYGFEIQLMEAGEDVVSLVVRKS